MFPLIYSILLWVLSSGGISVSCQSPNGGTFGKVTNLSESWSLSCFNEYSSDGSYQYVPISSFVTVPLCGTSGSYSVSANKIRLSNAQSTIATSILNVAWLCPESKPSFDSSFNSAISDVGKSVNFWGLFLAGIGAGIFLGVAPLTVNSIKQLLDGGKDDE